MRMAMYLVLVQQSFLKFDILHCLRNNKRSIYYNPDRLSLSFQIQFINVDYTVNAGSAIKCLLKKKQLSTNQQRNLRSKERKYHNDSETIRQAIKKRSKDKK